MLYFSNVIQHLLIDKKMSKREVAEKAGMLPASLSRSLNNENNDYHISTLCDIFKAIGCDISVNIIDSDTKEILYTLNDSE